MLLLVLRRAGKSRKRPLLEEYLVDVIGSPQRVGLFLLGGIIALVIAGLAINSPTSAWLRPLAPYVFSGLIIVYSIIAVLAFFRWKRRC